MFKTRFTQLHILLAAGDILVLSLVTLYGFASHNQLGTAGMRMLTTWIPLLVSWFLIAPLLQVFDLRRAALPRELWRPFWAMVLAAPWAVFIRAAMLNSAINPIFVVILGGVAALALLVWRALFLWIVLRNRGVYG
jgi:Protein of unknown function (DUF3054)